MKSWILGGGLLLLLLAAGGLFCWHWRGRANIDAVADEAPWFEDVTDTVGLDFLHDAGDLSRFQLPQIHGSGVAVFDFDGDGRPDIYLLTHGGPTSRSINRLYKNMPDGTFKDVTAGSGLGIAGSNTGVAIGDVNNDGWPDVVVTQYGGVKLFLNNGNGTFRDVTKEAGLDNPQWASSAAFVDYNRDGWLDLVVVNYVENDPSTLCHSQTSTSDYCGPLIFPGTVTRLFRNLGRTDKDPPGHVRFTDVTVAAGLAKAPAPGLAVYCTDFDGDGWPDLFIVNDGRPNHLWINQKDGTFTEEAYLHGVAVDAMGQSQAGMGIAVGDVDGDGLFDFYITHLTSEHNTLWINGPKRGYFHDHTARSGLLASAWRATGWGTLMGDFDHDGWLDIAVVNGRVTRGNSITNPALPEHLGYYGERNQLFRNEGKGNFRDISPHNEPFCGTANLGRGLACGDFTGDGSLGLVVNNVAGRARIYRNVARPRGHWLQVRALDPRLRRDAYGAEVVVRVADRSWSRHINPSQSYMSSSHAVAHFGLGEATRFDGIEVLWPDGRSEVFPGGSTDKLLVVRRGEGKEMRRIKGK